MGRRRTVPIATCDRPLHRKSKVTANGTFLRGDQRFRRYICQPRVGDKHTFTVLIDAGSAEPKLPSPPPPPCETHPGSNVVRDGPYGLSRGGRQRQRYRCTPADGSRFHRFTPRLPREHVHKAGETCEFCGTRKRSHQGQIAIARTHRFPNPTVAAGLDKISVGTSYGNVSRWALQTIGLLPWVPRRASPPAPELSDAQQERADERRKRVSFGARMSHNAWHIAADWTEAFGPVIWEPLTTRLRAEALAERARLDALIAAGHPLDRPQGILVDDIPVYAREAESGVSRRDAGFFVLVVAEVRWHDPRPSDPRGLPEPETKLRLLRAVAKSNTPAWRLVFDELGYTPDFLIGDASTAIRSGVEAHYGRRTNFVPSLWHLSHAIERVLLKMAGATVTSASGKRLVTDLRSHMALLRREGGALESVEGWHRWWDDLETLTTRLDLSIEKVRGKRRDYGGRMAAVLPALLANPEVPMSTGGLETIIDNNVQPVLEGRRAQLANIERTNSLLDLVVARHHGEFVNLGHIVDLLRADALAHGGYAVDMRSSEDPQPPLPQPVGDEEPPKAKRYSSLRDPTLLTSIARDRGLA